MHSLTNLIFLIRLFIILKRNILGFNYGEHIGFDDTDLGSGRKNSNIIILLFVETYIVEMSIL